MILTTICARGGSKGIPNKNIRLLLGKPLIAYTIEQAKECELIDRVIVSTDSDEIAKIAQQWGAEVPFIRSNELSTDTAGKLPAVQDAVKFMIEHEKINPKYVVDLDPTSPLRIIDDIKNSIKKIETFNCDVVISGNLARKNPYFNMIEIDSNGRAKLSKEMFSSIVRRQDCPKVYDMNASIYVFKAMSLLSMKALWDGDVRLYEMPVERSIDIDKEIDFEFVTFLMKNKTP